MLSIIAWDTDSTNAMLSYMGQIFDDFSGILLLIVSISLGVWAFSTIIGALRH
jgi:hypothetical protein